MKKNLMLILFTGLFTCIFSQEIPLDLFKNVQKCYVKTHRILPEYDLQKTYITSKKFYEFDNQGRIIEIQSYGGNDSYQGYYTYTYSDTLNVRTFYSTNNVITERFTTKYLNDFKDTEETLYSWGGKLLRRVISNTQADKFITKYEYYNDAGYPLYSDIKYTFPDGRIEKIVTNDYDGFPVYYDYYYYNDNKLIDSQRKVDYLDTLVTVVEYDYDNDDRLIKKSTINFKKRNSLVENFEYDILGRLTQETVFEKSEDYGGIEELIMKREIYYEGYDTIKEEFHRGDDSHKNLQAKLEEKARKDSKRLSKLKAKQDKQKEKEAKREKARLDKERMLLEERDPFKSNNDEKTEDTENTNALEKS